MFPQSHEIVCIDLSRGYAVLKLLLDPLFVQKDVSTV